MAICRHISNHKDDELGRQFNLVSDTLLTGTAGENKEWTLLLIMVDAKLEELAKLKTAHEKLKASSIELSVLLGRR